MPNHGSSLCARDLTDANFDALMLRLENGQKSSGLQIRRNTLEADQVLSVEFPQTLSGLLKAQIPRRAPGKDCFHPLEEI
jgi:hypothetical protein